MKKKIINFIKKNLPYIRIIWRFIRPKFYNRLTRVIVIVGLTLLSKPLWLEILNLIFTTTIDFSIFENDQKFGFLLICLALLYNVVVRISDLSLIQDSVKKEIHDKEIYNKIFLNEEFLSKMLNRFKSNIIYGSDIVKLSNVVRRADFIENRFLDENLNLQFEEFIRAINLLIKKFDNELETNKLKETNPYRKSLIFSPNDLIYEFTSQNSYDIFTQILIPDAIERYRNFRQEILDTLVI